MSAKNIDTKIPDDGNQDSGFITGPIEDPLDSGYLGAPTDHSKEPKDSKSDEVKCVDREEGIDSGIIESFDDLKLDSCDLKLDTHIPQQSSRLQEKPSRTQDLPPLERLYEPDEDGDTQLHIAAIHGCEKSLGILIKLCPNKVLLDIANDYRHTALHLAVMSGYSVVTRMLVLAGASLAIRDVNGRTPVHIAAETCQVECLKALLAPVKELPQRRLASILNQKDYNGQTCVHLAATAGHIKTLQTLVYYGADINIREGLAGWTALHIAARRGDVRLVQYLLQQCPGTAAAARDFGGRTARRLARNTRVERLFGKHAESDSDSDSDHDHDSEGETLFEKLLTNPTMINVA